jgi:hypothetical protein
MEADGTGFLANGPASGSSRRKNMGRSFFGAVVCAGLVIAAMAGRGVSGPAYGGGGEMSPLPPSGELIAHVTAVDGQPQIVTVIDPRQKVIGVYHVDRATGEITLKSVRNFTWDLQMVEFNSGEPLPQDIRSGLER